jgi:hypothetical protein
MEAKHFFSSVPNHMAQPLKRIKIFVLDRDDEGMSEEYLWVEKWLEKWGAKILWLGTQLADMNISGI